MPLKPYAAMVALHATLDAALKLAAEETIDAGKIKRIGPDISHASSHYGGWQAEKPLTVIGTLMNVSYAAAVAILDRVVANAQFAPDRIDADEKWRLVERVHPRLQECKHAGVAAIQIEDRVFPKRCGQLHGNEVFGIDECIAMDRPASGTRTSADFSVIARTAGRTVISFE